MNQKPENPAELAHRATHGSMRAAYYDVDEEALEEIRAGVRLCELIEATWEVLSTQGDIEKEPLSVYTMAKGLKEKRFPLSLKGFKEIAEKAKAVRERLKVFITNPENFPKDEMSEFQGFFARIGRVFFEKEEERKSLYIA